MPRLPPADSHQNSMIPRRHASYVFSFFMSLLMSCIMSGVITVFNVGLVDDIVRLWLNAWALAFVIALPTIIAVTPLVRRLVEWALVRPDA